MKPLEEKLKKMNEGVLSVELVEASSGDLPAVMEEDDNPIETDHDDLLGNIAYKIMQSGISETYVKDVEQDLDELLIKHDFRKLKDHYIRVRKEKVDYLYPNGFGNYDTLSTVGFTINAEDKEKFETELELVMGELTPIKELNLDIHVQEIIGSCIVGCVSGAILGFIPHAFGVGYLYSFAAIGFLISTAIYYISVKDRKSGVVTAEKHNTSINTAFENIMVGNNAHQSQKRYDAKVISHYLELTPKFLLEKK